MKTENRFYTVNNKQYPSVTTITSLLTKPALYGFYAKHGWDQAQKLSLIARKEGQKVHNLIHQFYENTQRGIETKIESLHTPKSFINFIRFYEELKPEFTECELIVHSKKNKYAGTLDAILKLDNKLVLVDWKTSGGIYEDYELQLEAYYRALVEMNNLLPLEEMWIIRLDKEKDMDYNKDVMKLKPDNVRFKAFLGLLSVFNWLENKKEK